MSNVFSHADMAIKVMYRTISREFQNFSTTLDFDEINLPTVKDQVSDLYVRIDKVVRSEYRKVLKASYEDTERELKTRPAMFASAAFMLAILRGFNGTSQFVYTHEWTRKRDRLVESLMSCSGQQEMRRALKRALDLMANQVRQYADIMTNEGRMEAFRVAGVARVMWNAENDSKTCHTCRDRDGEVYDIDDVPDLPAHWHCRCYLTAVS